MERSILKPRSVYLTSLGAVLLLAIYPLIMGAGLLAAYIKQGYVNAADYPKYVIPYTPIALALLLSVALLPLALRLLKRFSLPALSILGVGAFLIFEVLFERVTVFTQKEGAADVGSWQAFLCIATPQVTQTIEYKQTIGQALIERYSPAFKVHFYLISILIVLAVIGVVYGFLKMARDKNYDKMRPLILQTISAAVFIGLCVLACFTAFYRTGEINISALSSALMSVFFIVFGLTAGAYLGGLLYFKRPLYSRWIPAVFAALTTFVMYLGELVLMGGVLYKFGSGALFAPLGSCPLAIFDFLVIILSGGITYIILWGIRQNKP